MQSPIPFIKQKEGKLVLNEEVMSLIAKANNLNLFLFMAQQDLEKAQH